MSAHTTTGPVPISTTNGLSDKRRWSIVGLLFLASMINYFDRATISFALPFIGQTLNLGPDAKGVLLSSFFWSYALMQIPMGICADRFNLRWFYAGAFVLWSVAQGLTGFATTLGMLIFFRVILGIGEAIYLPGGTKIVSILFPPSARGFPIGIFDFGTRTGLVIEGLLVPWMLENYGWQTTFQIVGFTALLWLFPWFFATPRQLRGAPVVTESQEPPLVRHVRALGKGMAAAATNRNLFGICLGFFLFDYYWYLLVTWLPDYLVTVRKLTILKAGIYASLPFLVFGVSQPLGGWIADRLVAAGWDETRTRKGIITVAFLTGLLLIPAAHVTSANAALLFIIGGCLVGLSTANMLVILQHCAPPNEIGLWTGIYNFIGNIAGILAPLATGYIIKKTGSYTPPFVLAAVALAAGQLSFWFIVGPLRPRSTTTVTP
jgi:MFS transporter, ACS family, D-galactonate transporter